MPYILLGSPAYERFAGTLKSFGFAPISLPHDPRLNKTVSTHADTLIFSSGTAAIANADYIARLPENIADKLTAVSESPYGAYPTDTAFNALTVGRFMFARLASLAPSLKQYADDMGLTPINVNQGYAKCSTLAIPSARAAITADKGMAAAMESAGISVLRISEGHIALDGCEYGFIGGASFVWEPICCCSVAEHTRRVFFFGDIRRHPDGEAIVDFLHRFGCETVSLGGELTDFGGAVIIW